MSRARSAGGRWIFSALVAACLGACAEKTAAPIPPDITQTEGSDSPDVPDSDDTAAALPGALSTVPIGSALCVAGVPGGGERQTIGIARLQEAGVSRVRMDLRWSIVEPVQGEFLLEKLETRIGPYLEAGIDVQGILAYGVPWASSLTEEDAYYPPDDPADFANYVDAVTTWFRGRMTDYEIWNEPNAGYRFWKTEALGDPVAFGTLLIAAVTAGRQACPECRFAFGGPFFHSQLINGHIPFLTDVQAAHPDLSEHYDAMGFHPYPMYPPQAAPEGPPPGSEWAFSEMVAGVREVMALQGAGDRALWTTEVGWPVYGAVDAERQAAFLVRAYLHLVALQATPVCWYDLFEGPDPEAFPPEGAFGLLTRGDLEAGDPPTPKPAYQALSQLGNRFADYSLVQDLRQAGRLPEGVYGYALANAGSSERWWVLWRYPETEPLSVVLPADVLELRDMQGVSLPLRADSAGWRVDAHPRFFRMDTIETSP